MIDNHSGQLLHGFGKGRVGILIRPGLRKQRQRQLLTAVIIGQPGAIQHRIIIKLRPVKGFQLVQRGLHLLKIRSQRGVFRILRRLQGALARIVAHARDNREHRQRRKQHRPAHKAFIGGAGVFAHLFRLLICEWSGQKRSGCCRS